VLSFAELRRAARVVDSRFAGYRVERISQPGPFQLVLTCYGREDRAERGTKRHLFLSCDPVLARVAELERPMPSAERPPAFLQFVRPRLEGARLRSARVASGERQLSLHLEAGDGRFELLLSLLGKRSNCYVLAADATLLAAQRALEKTRKNLSIGSPWADPPPAELKEGEDRFAESDDDRYLVAIAAAYSGSEVDREGESLAVRIARVLRKQAKSAERRASRIEAELAEAERATEIQRHGELLKGVLDQIEPGASEVRAVDPESGEAVTIPLDPALGPRANLEATFSRYKKFLRRLTRAGSQGDEARAAVERNASLQRELETAVAAGAEAVAVLGDREDIARLLRKHGGTKPVEGAVPQKRKRAGPFGDLPRRLHPRRYRSADGLEIWVGRSDEGNDHLSTRLARGRDLFFHLDGAPGSHVVLRTEGRTDPPSESLVDACELAVHFSKSKRAGRADVHIVPIKNVKKPRGAKRGLVYVSGGRTFHLRREAARLERLLAARIDD
jgi:predicted ribosome quality control (RQC) complex YloA/Tae2 family protein